MLTADQSIIFIVVALIGSIGGIAAFITAVGARKDSKDTRQQMAEKVDVEAYRTAQDLYGEMLARAREERFEFERRLLDAEARLKAAEQSLARETTRNQFLELTVADLRTEVKYLRQRLVFSTIGDPPAEPDVDELDN